VVIPGEAFQVRAVRSGGPGGQNVNKVSSKIELRVDLSRVGGIDGRARDRLRAIAAPSLDAEGWLLVTSQRTRDHRQNLEDAREKVRALVARCLHQPRVRRKTAPTRSSQERRIDQKKQRGRLKAGRRGPSEG
jgi:ribosome-associated protein